MRVEAEKWRAYASRKRLDAQARIDDGEADDEDSFNSGRAGATSPQLVAQAGKGAELAPRAILAEEALDATDIENHWGSARLPAAEIQRLVFGDDGGELPRRLAKAAQLMMLYFGNRIVGVCVGKAHAVLSAQPFALVLQHKRRIEYVLGGAAQCRRWGKFFLSRARYVS